MVNLERSIKSLNLGKKIESVLMENNINSLNELWSLKRNNLKKMKLSDNDINTIIIKLQLNGIDLGKKIYK